MSQVERLLDRLSAEERSSLLRMGLGPLQRLAIVGREEWLIELGLAELVFGEPELTAFGRKAAALLEARAP